MVRCKWKWNQNRKWVCVRACVRKSSQTLWLDTFVLICHQGDPLWQRRRYEFLNCSQPKPPFQFYPFAVMLKVKQASLWNKRNNIVYPPTSVCVCMYVHMYVLSSLHAIVLVCRLLWGSRYAKNRYMCCTIKSETWSRLFLAHPSSQCCATVYIHLAAQWERNSIKVTDFCFLKQKCGK